MDKEFQVSGALRDAATQLVGDNSPQDLIGSARDDIEHFGHSDLETAKKLAAHETFKSPHNLPATTVDEFNARYKKDTNINYNALYEQLEQQVDDYDRSTQAMKILSTLVNIEETPLKMPLVNTTINRINVLRKQRGETGDFDFKQELERAKTQIEALPDENTNTVQAVEKAIAAIGDDGVGFTRDLLAHAKQIADEAKRAGPITHISP